MTRFTMANLLLPVRKNILPFMLVCMGLMAHFSANGQTDIQLTKTVNDATANEGQSIVYTINVKNVGVNATGVVIKDLLPSAVNYISHVAAVGTYDPVTGIWNVGALNAGQNKNLTITVTPKAGTSGTDITNTAIYQSSSPADNNAANNSASVEVSVNPVSLSVVQTVSDASPSVGQTLTYSIKLTNAGPSTATNIVINDTIPQGLTFVNVTPYQWVHGRTMPEQEY